MLRYIKRYWKLLPILSQKRSHGEVWRSFLVIFGDPKFCVKCYITIIVIYHRFCCYFKHNSRTSKDAFCLLCPIQLIWLHIEAENEYLQIFITDRQMYRESWPFNFSIGQTYWSSCFIGQKFKKNFANIFLWGQWINTFVYLYGDNFSVSKSLGVWGENGRLSIRPKWPIYPRGAFYFRAKFSRSLFTGGINFLWRLIRLHP